jgi:segregation and condensation protein B
LLERDWIKVLGHKDVPGKPTLYGTTKEFLDYFNLKKLDELPTLAEIRDLDSIHPELELDEDARDASTGEGSDVGDDAPKDAIADEPVDAEALETVAEASEDASDEEDTTSVRSAFNV